MATWVLPATVNPKKDYYYEVDKAFEELKVIYWAQTRPLKNITVGDIVYIYEGIPIQAIGWKCEVIAANLTVNEVEYDDTEFEHGETDICDSYIKLKAVVKYEGEARVNLSVNEMLKNGLNHNIRSPFRLKEPLLNYISSVEGEAVN